MPPKAALKNISNREYYSTMAGRDSPELDVISLSSNSSRGSKKYNSPPAKSEKAIYAESSESLVVIKRAETPSPTPSDIILQLDHEHIAEFSARYEQLRRDGVDAKESKRRLLNLQLEREGGGKKMKQKKSKHGK